MSKKLCLLSVLVCAVVLGGSREARAEREYEFGKALMEELGYFDLAEEQFKHVQDDPKLGRQQRLEGTLGLGTLKKRLAKQATAAAETSKLFDEALTHFKKFLDSCGSSHPLRGTAIQEMADIRLEYAKAVAKQIEAETDKDKVAQLLARAEKLFDEALKPLKEAADLAFKKYQDKEKSLEDVPEDRVKAKDKMEIQKLTEVAVMTRRRHVHTMLQKTEIYPKASEKRKKFVEEVILKEIDAQIDNYLMFDLVVKWFELAKGRAYAQIGDYKTASEKGFDAVISLDTRGQPKGIRLYIDGIKKPAYYLKAKCAFETGEYREAVSTVDLMIGLDYRDSLKENIGKGAVIVKADALVALGDYNEAMKSLEAILKSTKPGDPWINSVHQKRAEILGKAEKAGVQLERDPGALHSSALGLYQKRNFEKAVRAYRKAILAARDPDLGYMDRLKWEPRCWFEMGLAYFKLQLTYESALCFETVLQNFSPHILGERFAKSERWSRLLTDIKGKIAKGEIKSEVEGTKPNAYSELFKDLSGRPNFKEVLPEVGGYVKKSADNFRKVIGLRRRQTKDEADVRLYLYALKVLVEVRPELAAEKDYFFAEALYQEGDGLLADSGAALRSDVVTAAQKLRQGIETLGEAAAGFSKVRRTSRLYETALHKSANTHYRIITALSRSRKYIKSIKKEDLDKHGRLCLEFYDKYLEFIKAHPAVDRDTARQRKKYSSDIFLAKPLVYLTLGEAQKTIDACNVFMALKERNKDYDALVMWTQFKAYRELATAAVASVEEMEANLAKMVALGKKMEAHPKAGRYYKTAGNYIAATYGTVSNALIIKRQTIEKSAAGIEDAAKQKKILAELNQLESAIKKYKGESAVWFAKMLGADPSMQELGSIGKIFYNLGRYAEAKKIYEQLLQTFDPDGDLKSKELYETEFAELRDKIWFDDEKKTERARTDWDKVKDYIFDKEDSKKKAPEERDEELQDYGKALDIINGMIEEKKGYCPKVQIRKEVEAIKAELETRLMFMVASQQISECYVSLAKEAEKVKDEAVALENWKKANERFNALLNFWYTDVDLRFGLAESYAALGKRDDEMYKKARDVYIELKENVAYKSDKWFDANKALSEVFLAMGEARKAVSFAILLRETMPAYGKNMWPDMEDFIKKCEAKGVEIASGDDVEMENVVYEGLDEIEKEYKNMIKSAKLGLKEKRITKEQYDARLEQAEGWKSKMRRDRARANERDAIRTKHAELMDEARYWKDAKRDERKFKEKQAKADTWREKKLKELEAKYKAEDAKKGTAEDKKDAEEKAPDEKGDEKAGEEKEKPKEE